MAVDARRMPAGPGRAGRSLLTAALLAAANVAVAVAAVAGGLELLRSPFDDGNLSTQVVRASGIVALIWAYAGLVLGLLIGIRPIGRVRRGQRPGRSVVLSLHRQLNLVVLALVLLHALVFAIGMPGGSLRVAFLPSFSGPQSLGYTLGVFALYLAVLLGPSYYVRDRIGRRTWLIAHQLAAMSYAVALWHALALGTEVRMDGLGRTLTWALQIPLLVLIVLRLFRPRRPADQLSAALRRGRYTGVRHARLRAAITLGLFSSAVLILLMALLAGSEGLRVNG